MRACTPPKMVFVFILLAGEVLLFFTLLARQSFIAF